VDSKTSLGCFFVAAGIFLVARNSAVIREPKKIIRICFLFIVVFGIMEFAFDIKDTLIAMLGRRPDLTTRVPMWEELLSMVKNPLLGCGYESFWIGERLIYMEETWGIKSQAHNGYLEMYLNMGLVGVCFIVCWVVSGLRKINRKLANDNSAAVLRFCFVVVIVIYNWTEATFYGNNNLWLLFFLGIMDMPREINKNVSA
jgi:O-antigen ligase